MPKILIVLLFIVLTSTYRVNSLSTSPFKIKTESEKTSQIQNTNTDCGCYIGEFFNNPYKVGSCHKFNDGWFVCVKYKDSCECGWYGPVGDVYSCQYDFDPDGCKQSSTKKAPTPANPQSPNPSQDCGCYDLRYEKTYPTGYCVIDNGGAGAYTWRICIKNQKTCQCEWFDTGDRYSCKINFDPKKCK